MCSVLKFSRSTYYTVKNRKISKKTQQYQEFSDKVKSIFEVSNRPTFCVYSIDSGLLQLQAAYVLYTKRSCFVTITLKFCPPARPGVLNVGYIISGAG